MRRRKRRNARYLHKVDVLGVERRKADEHLVEEDAERPPVDFLAVADSHDHFRRQVLGRAAKGLGLGAVDLRAAIGDVVAKTRRRATT